MEKEMKKMEAEETQEIALEISHSARTLVHAQRASLHACALY